MSATEQLIVEPKWPERAAAPHEMRAITIREFGGPDVLKMEALPTPEPGPGEVLVRVAATSVGAALDVAARAGRHPFGGFRFPHVLGAECAGTVVASGDHNGRWLVGEHVAVFPVVFPAALDAPGPDVSAGIELIGTQRQGSYAEYVAVPRANVRVVPPHMDPVDAVSVVMAGSVAMKQFDRVGGVGPGSRVVVIGGASALGSTTALLAKHLGAQVVGTSRSPDKRARLLEHGIEAVDPREPGAAERIRALFDGAGADLIIDNLGQPESLSQNFDMLVSGGHLVCSGAILGAMPCLDMRQLYLRGLTIHGVRTADLDALDKLWAEVHRGFNRGVVDQVFPLQQVADAHRRVESGANVGRVVLAGLSA
jgi:NADPH:quinone reductase-like Zn-dependent oxidoreductase